MGRPILNPNNITDRNRTNSAVPICRENIIVLCARSAGLKRRVCGKLFWGGN